MYCRKCGKEIDDEAAFCVNCGVAAKEQPVINVINNNTNTNVNNNTTGYIHKKKWTAFWLCLFLGWAGAHRFYLGKAGSGIVWLLTGGLFGIVFLPDLVADFIDPPCAHVVRHVRLDDALAADPFQKDGVLLRSQVGKRGKLSENDFIPGDVVHPFYLFSCRRDRQPSGREHPEPW